MKIGLIRGRHPLPVEKYLIEQAEVPFDQAHRMAYDAMQKQYESVIAFRSGAIMTEVLDCQGSYQFVWGTYAPMEGA